MRHTAATRLNPARTIQKIRNRRMNFSGAVAGGGGGGGTGGGTAPVFPTMAQAASAAGSRYLLTYNQAYPTLNLARVAGVTNTTLGLPAIETNYSKNLAELIDTNGVLSLASAATGLSTNVPALAALSDKIWLKGRLRVDEIRALAANGGMGLMQIDSDGAGTNKKCEVYLSKSADGTTFVLSVAPYKTGSVRIVVASTPAILLTTLPPAGCYVNWFVGYDSTLGTITAEYREDGGTLLTDTHTSSILSSLFPAFTGTLTANAALLGATSIVLAATTLTGTLAIGATITIGGFTYTNTAAATAAANTLTMTVAATAQAITAGTAAAFTASASLNTDGGANGRISIGKAFNGGVIACAKVMGGLAVYSGAVPAIGALARWQPGQPADTNLLALWLMDDATSGALTTVRHSLNGGFDFTITGTAAGLFDVGAMNCWSSWPNGPGGLCTDENQWKEFHFITSVTSPTSMVLNFTPDPTVDLCRAQGTPSRAYIFEGQGGVASQYNGVVVDAASATQTIQTLVAQLVGHYVTKYGTAAQGGIREWNLANEWLQGGSLQSSTWSAFLPNWVTVAALAVHAADPTAMIMVNLDNIELAANSAQKTGMLNACSALIAAGIPPAKIIAGSEFHLRNDVGFNPATDGPKFLAFITSLAALGVWWCASECDVTDKALDGGAGNPNIAGRPARQALNVVIWNNFFSSVMTAAAWASVWSFGGWQLSPITSWINTNALGAGIERTDGDLEYTVLLDEHYARMGGVGSLQDCYGCWMTFFASRAGSVPVVPGTNTPNMPAGLKVVFNSGPIGPSTAVIPTTPVRGSILQINGPVPGAWTYLSPGQGVDDDPANLTFAINDSSDAGAYGFRTRFPVGKVSDPALCLELPLTPQGVRKLYWAYDGRLAPTFDLASFKANAMKFANPKDNGGNDNIGMAFLGFKSGSGYFPGAGIQGPVTVNIPNNNIGQFGSKFFQPGDIPRFEHLWVSDNPLGGGNGTYQIWQDNVLASFASLELEGAGAGLGFRDMVLYIARAVTGGNPTTAWYWDWNNLVIALDG